MVGVRQLDLSDNHINLYSDTHYQFDINVDLITWRLATAKEVLAFKKAIGQPPK